MSVITAREASLFLFHALGKVLYSKRKRISIAVYVPILIRLLLRLGPGS